jgi:hypothetical protein
MLTALIEDDSNSLKVCLFADVYIRFRATPASRLIFIYGLTQSV